ncbi:hypothetical protein R6Q59_020623 [Mikania micrantha]
MTGGVQRSRLLRGGTTPSGPSTITPRLITGHSPSQRNCLLWRPWLQPEGWKRRQSDQRSL